MATYKISWLGYPKDLDYENTPTEEWVQELVYETDDLDDALRTAELNTIKPGSDRQPPVMVAPHIHEWCFVDGDATGSEGPATFYTCRICGANLTEVCDLGREDFPGTTEWAKWNSLWLPAEEELEEWD